MTVGQNVLLPEKVGKGRQRDRASKRGLKTPAITENARRVLEKRYLIKGVDGRPVETVEDMFGRVAENIAQADRLYDPEADLERTASKFYEMMVKLDFMPNSPTLMNAGRELQQLSACFVLPVNDSMESIFETIKHTALIHKSGGGTGFSFSRLRPSGDVVGSTSGISSGPISFMTVFDSATEAIKQGGTRRGANMGILRVDHPDILQFITCKEDGNRLNNFNISVAITEEFMKAAEAGEEYNLKNPRTGEITGTLNAKEVFDKVVDMAWRNGDPGIIFIDRINRGNPTPHIGEIESTNPCGEQPLLPYESCNLGSINLARMAEKNGDGGYVIDWKKLERIIINAVHFLDNVIDMNRYPIEEIDNMTKGNRKIGLGVMGFADLLIRLGIPYDSDEAIDVAERLMAFIQEKGRETSKELTLERDVYPNYKCSTYDGVVKVRNATVTTIAPTGTISIIAGCSSGIEPLFALTFTRNVLDGAELVEANPIFEEIAKEQGFYSPEIMMQIAKTGGLSELDDIPEEIKKIFVTSHDISPECHIKMQAAFQKYTDNAVSKTVNFPNNATPDDVGEVYRLAYKLGCKGVTVYRDGSRDVQVLNKGQETKTKTRDKGVKRGSQSVTLKQESTDILIPKPRGEVTFGATKKMNTGCGKLYVTINEDEKGKPFEVFTQIGKAGGCAASQCEAIGRLVSLTLRSGIPTEELIMQLKSITCHKPAGFGDSRVASCSDAVAKALEWYVMYKVNVDKKFSDILLIDTKPDKGGNGKGKHSSGYNVAPLQMGACPDCGGGVEHVDGCAVCRGCGYSEC
ncbi:MAG: vitamin B12-dependent ribonucleotide reductase [Thermodesulfobacteriota bacterium]